MARPPADADDLETIREVLSGHEDAYRRLVEKYQASIFNLAYRMTGSPADADDLAQEAFVQAYRRLRDFRVGSRFHPWLYTIALNLCRNHLRRRAIVKWVSIQGRKDDDIPLDRDLVEPSANPEQELLARESEERLARAIRDLPVKYREVFLLRQVQELSYEEIADVTGVPLGTVETRLFRARKLLMQNLDAPPRRGTK